MQGISNIKSDIETGHVSMQGGIKKYRMHTGQYDRSVIPFPYFSSVPSTPEVAAAIKHFKTMHPQEKLKMLSIYDQSQDAHGCVTINPNFEKVLPLLDAVNKLHNPATEKVSHMKTMKTAQEQLAFDRGFIKQAREQGYADEQIVELYKRAAVPQVNLAGGLNQQANRAANNLSGASLGGNSRPMSPLSAPSGPMRGISTTVKPPPFGLDSNKPNSMAMAFKKPTTSSIMTPTNVAGTPHNVGGNALLRHQPMVAGVNKIPNPIGQPNAVPPTLSSPTAGDSLAFNPSPGKWGAGAGQTMGQINAGGGQLAMSMGANTPSIKGGAGASFSGRA